MILDKFTSYHIKTINSLDMNLSAITSNKPSPSSGQPSAGLIKWPLLKSLEKYSHASQFTKHLSSMNLEGDTLLQLQKLWDAIRSAF